MFYQRPTLFLHQVSAPKTKFCILVFLFNSFHQVGSVQITGSFTCNDIIFQVFCILDFESLINR